MHDVAVVSAVLSCALTGAAFATSAPIMPSVAMMAKERRVRITEILPHALRLEDFDAGFFVPREGRVAIGVLRRRRRRLLLYRSYRMASAEPDPRGHCGRWRRHDQHRGPY